MRNNRCRFTEGYLLTVLKFPADTAIRGRSSALFQRNIRCRRDGRTSSAVKGTFQRLTALRLARLRRSRPRFAGHLAAPRPLHTALPCGGGRPQSSLTLAPPAVKGAYFSLSTVNLNRAKSKRYRQLQQRIAEAWFRHIFLPAFKNSGSLKTTCQSRRFRNEQLSFSLP